MTTDMTQFLQTFYEESFEGLEIMESGLLNLDVGAADSELVNDIFRAAHSIKGGSATFGLGEVAAFTHLMETLLDELRDGRRDVSQEIVELLLSAVDCLREMLTASRAEEPLEMERIDELKASLQRTLDAGAAPKSEATTGSSGGQSTSSGWRILFKPFPHLFKTGNDPVRIFRELGELGELTVEASTDGLPPFEQLDPEESYLAWTLTLRGSADRAAVEEVFAWVEDDCELEITPLEGEAVAGPQPIPAAESDSGISGELLLERRRSTDRRRGNDRRGTDRRGGADSGSIRVGIEKVDAVIDMVGELVITQSMLSTLGEDFEMEKLQKLRDGLAQLERNTRELQENVMRMRMLPISFVFSRFPRMVHDLSQQLGKEIELRMTGEGTELDKTVIEKITDPLVHLVRNSLDHGIEPTVEERVATGKPPVGVVRLNAYHKGGNIVIEVIDDGRGMDAERLFRKAVERGLVDAEAQLSPEQIFDLIFMPGFSTAEQVSDVSGRGVGMDVVRKNIQSLGGTVEIQSELGKGSTFSVRLPLTLAILDGQTVSVGDELYIVPLVSITESIQVKEGMINHVANKGQTFRWRGDYLPIIRLSQIFGAESKVASLTEGLIVVVEGDGRHVGLFVDDLLGQQQVVIKSMEANYRKIDGISGATILGDGSVALILDIPGLIRISNQQAELQPA